MGVLCKRAHAAALGFCARGCRQWIKDHGLDYLKFVREGIDESVFLEANDEMAVQLVAEARRQAAEEGT
jgi:hypothetical protein